MRLIGNQIILNPDEISTNPKLITGTRLAAILGMNEYSTPFQCWAEMQKVWTPPFEDTKYTLAGKTIEPKQAEYIKSTMCPELTYPRDIFGENYFGATHGNFFHDEHFGGMWDYIHRDELTGATHRVFEMKTAGKSKKSSWNGEKIPESYALQASLYAWLLGCDDVTMVATFLDQKLGDYDLPSLVVVSEHNTITKSFKVSERYPHFKEDYIDPAIKWWDDYIVTGISPEYDPHNPDDCAVIQELRSKMTTTEYTNITDASDTVPECNAYVALDDLILEIREHFGVGSTPNHDDISKYLVELATAVYFTSTKAVEEEDAIGYDKISNAKEMMNTLRSMLTHTGAEYASRRTSLYD